MAIIKASRNHATRELSSETFFEGAVLKIEERSETRNWSDTLDYNDFRDTRCTWALVWLGLSGPRIRRTINGRLVTYIGDELQDEVVDLQPHEQFAWMDCTNLHQSRNGETFDATVCENWKQAALSGPIMWENYLLWQAEQARLLIAAQQAEIARLAAASKRDADEATKLATKKAKDETLKTVAEGMLARIPTKGTVVTVDGFTGKIFWAGVTKYRNAWNANAGVKNTKGTVKWVSASMF